MRIRFWSGFRRASLPLQSGFFRSQFSLCSLRALIAGLCLLTLGCASKIVVRPVAQAPKLNGIVYALPKTVVTATVTLKRIDNAPGVYAGYAPCFFHELDPATDVTYEKTSRIKISDATFSSRGVPDTTQVYVINIGAGWLQKKTIDAQLTESGLLTSSNAEVKNEALTFTVSTIKSAAAIGGNIMSTAGQFAFIRLSAMQQPPEMSALKQCAATLEQLSGKLRGKKPFDDAVTELRNITQARDAAAQQGLLAASKFSRAKLAFDRMANLITAREQAVSSPPNGSTSVEALKEQLSEYNDTVNQYAEYFLGSTTTKSWTPAFDVTPDEGEKIRNNPTEYALFTYRASSHGAAKPVGVCIDNKHTEVVVAPDFSMDAQQCQSMQDGLSASLAVQEALRDALVAVDAAPELKGERSYYYRIPDSVVVTLEDAGKPLANTTLLLAQWGKVASLPAGIGSIRSKYKVQIAPVTGALTNFSMDSDAKLEGSDFSGLESASKSVTDPITTSKNKLNK